MVVESCMCGKCVVITLLLEQTHFSLLNVKMQTKLKDMQTSFLLSFTSWYYSFSFSSLIFIILVFFPSFLTVCKTLVFAPSCTIRGQSSERIFFLKLLLIWCCWDVNAPAATIFWWYIPCQLKISEATKAC